MAAELMGNYGVPPVTFVRGSGAELYDDRDKRYLDFLCGLAVTSLGHAHPAVTAAIAEQAGVLTHVSNLFANEPTAEVVNILDRLVRWVGPPEESPERGDDGAVVRYPSMVDEPGRVLFQNSGAEANEAAIKLVRKYQGRGRHVIVSALRSFHGRTLAALAATGQPEKHEPFQPLPEGFHHVEWNDLDALERMLSPAVGAILLEPVQGEGGVNPADPAYLKGVRQICDERGILLVMDEIQTGLARTGEWFGFQHAEIRPDVVTMAKALGNGFPVGAVWARREVADAFGPGDHGSTFAGQPLALAVTRVVLKTMLAMDAPRVVREKEATLRALLAELPGIDHVRGSGLLLGIELDAEARAGRTAAEIARECLRQGLVINGVTPTALRVAPPFVITDEQLAEGVAVLRRVLEVR
jgi:predicted acetylornithine/succinylornithine family transaminase